MKILFGAALSAVSLAIGSSFAVSRGPAKPSAFVAETFVPWHDRANILFSEPLVENSSRLLLSDYPDWERAALTYERVVGIPGRFFHECLCAVV